MPTKITFVMCLNSNPENVQKCIYQGIICTSYLSRFNLEFWLTEVKYSNVGSICNLDNKLWCHVTNYYFFFDMTIHNYQEIKEYPTIYIFWEIKKTLTVW